MRLYVGMELNDGDLVPDAGQMNNLTLLSSAREAKEWFLNRVRSYLYNSEYKWVLDETSPLLVDDENVDLGDISAIDQDYLEQSIERFATAEYAIASITLFKSFQENWDENFSINLYAREVDDYDD